MLCITWFAGSLLRQEGGHGVMRKKWTGRQWAPTRLWLVLALLVPGCATQENVLQAKAHEDAGGFVQVGRLRTFYVQKGAKDQPALVLIHGIAASTFSFRHNIEPLAAHFAVYALDLKGFGATDKPLGGYGLDDLRDHVSGFMDVMGLGHAVLIGNSMGGEVAIRLALSQPERVDGLVLIDPAGFMRWWDTPLEGRVMTLAPGIGELLTAPLPLQRRVNRRVVARYLRRVYHDPTLVTPEVVDGYYLPMARMAGNRGFLARMRAHDWGGVADRIGEITAPTMVLWGEEDQLIPVAHAERFRGALPDAKIIVYPDAGHNPHAEVPELVNRDIIDFVDSLS